MQQLSRGGGGVHASENGDCLRWKKRFMTTVSSVIAAANQSSFIAQAFFQEVNLFFTQFSLLDSETSAFLSGASSAQTC
nr:hypothetical protein Iba_chr02dCG3980 [Ipomoea batatas]GMC66439.1 hypothetical protein Iba_chr02eCG5720 [Ipomoea batatas]